MKNWSDYDKEAIKEIHIWKKPEQNFMEKILSTLTKPIDALMDASYVKDAIQKASQGILGLLCDAASGSVRPEAIFEEFNVKIVSLDDISKLNLQTIDKTVGYLAAKYKGLAATEGALVGGASLAGPVAAAAAIAVDIPVITGLCLRAIGEYATYYGFDIDTQPERLFALNVLSLASSPTDVSKQASLASLIKISKLVAQKKTLKELEQHAFAAILMKLANSLGLRLTKNKLAQIIPGLSVAVASGYNAYLISEVCECAFMMYRERHLARFYNDPGIIEVTVKPSEELIFIDEGDQPEDEGDQPEPES